MGVAGGLAGAVEARWSDATCGPRVPWRVPHADMLFRGYSSEFPYGRETFCSMLRTRFIRWVRVLQKNFRSRLMIKTSASHPRARSPIHPPTHLPYMGATGHVSVRPSVRPVTWSRVTEPCRLRAHVRPVSTQEGRAEGAQDGCGGSARGRGTSSKAPARGCGGGRSWRWRRTVSGARSVCGRRHPRT
jgi:hypothetical protein